MQFNLQIERFLRQHSMAATRFGRLAAGDPRLVLDMRNGRQVGLPLQSRLRGFIDGYAAAEKHGAGHESGGAKR